MSIGQFPFKKVGLNSKSYVLFPNLLCIAGKTQVASIVVDESPGYCQFHYIPALLVIFLLVNIQQFVYPQTDVMSNKLVDNMMGQPWLTMII
jgi:hypothetical protein